MKSIKTVNWTAQSGKKVTVNIEITQDVQDDISYSDGWNINHGKKTVDTFSAKIIVDGRLIERTYTEPHVITRQAYRTSYDRMIAAGVFARIGDTYIKEDLYNLIMVAITEAKAEIAANTTTEYKNVKTAEDQREAIAEAKLEAEAAEYQQLIDSGMCPKCGSWCYGDCGLSR